MQSLQVLQAELTGSATPKVSEPLSPTSYYRTRYEKEFGDNIRLRDELMQLRQLMQIKIESRDAKIALLEVASKRDHLAAEREIQQLQQQLKLCRM